MATNEVKDRIIKVNDIPADAKQLCLQYSKPFMSYVVCGLLAGTLVYFPQTRILGVITAAFFVFIFSTSKNRKFLLLTDKFAVSYNADLETAKIVYYDEVRKWEMIAIHDIYSISFELNDETMIAMQTTNHFAVEPILKKIMPEKENKHELKLIRKKPNKK